MKKTINTNLAGIIFYLDEDAYAYLENYLTQVKQYLGTIDGANEILQDIEGRIAELFREWKPNAEEVITLDDVKKIEARLGKPENYESTEKETTSQQEAENNAKKRLFRDPENGLIAGVCMGVAQYFNWNVIWVRLLTIILLIGVGPLDFGSTIITTYIICWIILPKAKTRMDYFKMYGKPMTIDSLKGSMVSFREEFRQNKLNLNALNFEQIIGKFFKLIYVLIKIFIALLSMFFLAIFILSLISFTIALIFDSAESFNLFERIVPYNGSYIIGILSIIGLFLALSFMCARLALKCFNIKTVLAHKNLKYIFLSLFSLSIIGILTLTGLYYNENKYECSRIITTKITPHTNDSIIIIDRDENVFHNNVKLRQNKILQIGSLFLNEKNELTDNINRLLNIEKTNDKESSLETEISASGKNYEQATINTQHLQFQQKIDSGHIQLPSKFSIKNSYNYNNQEVIYKLKIPVGTKIKVNNAFYILDDAIHNNHKHQDKTKHSTINGNEEEYHFLEMTEDGLNCLNCD